MRYRILSGIVLIIALLAGAVGVRAASTTVFISEVQTGSSSSASQEFVELYNASSQNISLTGWKIEYKSASGSSWSVKATLTGTIPSHGFYLLAASGYALSADQTFSAGLSGTGGHVRLTDGVNAVDLVGWGTALAAEGAHAASAPAGGQSIERLPGRLNDSGGNGIDTDDNTADFIIRATPEPQSAASPTEVPDLTTPVSPPDDDTAPEAPDYLPLMITELLIDPASPQLDSQHEFIEVYNPNDEPVNLEGYTLRTGLNFHDYYILPAQTLGSGEYIVFYAGITHLALTNSGGAAQLLDPAGAVVSQTQTYEKAATSTAWGLFDGAWKWTLALTPATENVLDEPAPAAVKTAKAAVVKAPAKKAVAKKPKSSAKPKAAKKAATKEIKKSGTSAFANVSSTVGQPSAGVWLIIGLATLTIGYAIYEYWQDLQNRLYLARRKFKAWRANRTRP